MRNTGEEAVPNLAVTVNGFDSRSEQPDLADPSRPRFAVNGVPVEIGGFPEARDADPAGLRHRVREHVGLRDPRAGRRADAALDRDRRWPRALTRWTTAWPAGLNGKAKAVLAGGDSAAEGSFAGTVSDKPQPHRVGPDGKTVVN